MRSNGTLNDVLGGGSAEKLINDVLGGGTAEKLLKSRTLNGAFLPLRGGMLRNFWK